jgi:hypothetical protein
MHVALDIAQGGYGIQCSGPQKNGVTCMNISKSQMDSRWAFTDVNTVPWTQASRVAERFCAAQPQDFADGHFTGHMVGDTYGLLCYKDGAQFFDATDAKINATGWGFSTDNIDDVPWAQASRVGVGFCRDKGFSGGS